MNEIGEKLKEARKEKGYTLDDLQQMTKIQKRYLIAVEEGNMDVLPGSFYARAFIKQYADSVGLNGEELINEHVDALPTTKDSNYSENVKNTQTRSKGKNSGFLATLQESLPTILIVLLVIAIIVAIYFAVTSGGTGDDESQFIQEDDTSQDVEVDDNSDDEETDEETDEGTDNEENDTDETTDGDEAEDGEDDEESLEEEEEPDEQVVEETDGTNTSTTYLVSAPHPPEQQVSLTAEGGDSWVSVEVDGSLVNQAHLSNGETLTADFDDSVSTIALVIGNAAATTIELNDESLPYGSAASEAVRQEMYIEFE